MLAAISVRFKGHVIRVVHEEEACPLHADLCNSKQSSGTGEVTNLLATRHVPCAFRQCEHVCDACCAGHGSQQHKHGTKTARRASRNDLVVLWEVGYEDADDEEAVDDALATVAP